MVNPQTQTNYRKHTIMTDIFSFNFNPDDYQPQTTNLADFLDSATDLQQSLVFCNSQGYSDHLLIGHLDHLSQSVVLWGFLDSRITVDMFIVGFPCREIASQIKLAHSSTIYNFDNHQHILFALKQWCDLVAYWANEDDLTEDHLIEQAFDQSSDSDSDDDYDYDYDTYTFYDMEDDYNEGLKEDHNDLMDFLLSDNWMNN
jgi:hypothetical protein